MILRFLMLFCIFCYIFVFFWCWFYNVFFVFNRCIWCLMRGGRVFNRIIEFKWSYIYLIDFFVLLWNKIFFFLFVLILFWILRELVLVGCKILLDFLCLFVDVREKWFFVCCDLVSFVLFLVDLVLVFNEKRIFII